MLSAAPMTAQVINSYGIGASEIAAACGISRYRSQFVLWLEKTGRRPAFAGNLYTRLGQLCEPHARQLYANATGLDVEVPRESIYHPTVPWARCTPDGLILPRASRHGMQIKCVGYFVGRRFKYELPIEYEAQVQWEMFVCDLDRVDLAVLVGSDDLLWERFILGEAVDPSAIFAASMLEVYTIARSEAAIASLYAGAAKFWAMVQADEQPPIDDSPEAAGYFNSKARKDGVTIAESECQEDVDAYRAAVLADKNATKALDTAKNRVRAAMTAAGANRITTADGPIDLRIDRRGVVSLHAPKSWAKDEIQ